MILHVIDEIKIIAEKGISNDVKIFMEVDEDKVEISLVNEVENDFGTFNLKKTLEREDEAKLVYSEMFDKNFEEEHFINAKLKDEYVEKLMSLEGDSL